MARLSLVKSICALVLLCVLTAIPSAAQALNRLVSFNVANGDTPQLMSLVQGTDGNLYGTTTDGGYFICRYGCGTVFKITPDGSLTTLHYFDMSDGSYPRAGLVLGTDGNLYGTTTSGGAYFGGTAFKITPDGTLTTISDFCQQSGCKPWSTLVEAVDGNFYGTTNSGGRYAHGTVFKMTPKGMITTLHSFDDVDGAAPEAGLIQGADGNFYGTTVAAGAYGAGTVFKITAGGTLTTLHNFCELPGCTDGAGPMDTLVQAPDGSFFGTTFEGGTGGTVFEMTAEGLLTTLYSFCPQRICTPDGEAPQAGLVIGSDGNFYGTTLGGGNGEGTVFRITPTGTLTTLYSFCAFQNCADGSQPDGGLVQATNGEFYGTTSRGGARNAGTIFRLFAGLRPFISFVRGYGKIGQTGGILGQGFTGTTGVSFNGVPANFAVVSDTFLRATVPSGATTGYVTVTTPGGTLTSNVPFQVIQ